MVARRRFLQRVAGAAGCAALAGLGLGAYVRQTQALPAHALRPPGALPEERFGAACLRCGQCVRACPYGTLRLSQLGDGVATGTPYFVAREVPCEMCPQIHCVKACPSAALEPKLEDIDRARMGLAVLVDQENCLNWLGLRCEVCYRVCPLIGKAITLELRHNERTAKHAIFLPTVHAEHCTGCGKCERSCVLEQAAIKVLPLKQAKGEMGAHYRLGWKENVHLETLQLPARRPE